MASWLGRPTENSLREDMKAAVLNTPQGELAIEDVRDPEPGFGEVLIRVVGCGVCHSDLHVMRGELPFPMPCVLGHEVSGTIVALGPGAMAFEIGDRVVSSFIIPCGRCSYCVRGEEDLCEIFFKYNRLQGTLYDGKTRIFRSDGSPVWMYSMGGLAEYCVVPDTDVFRLPDHFPLAESAILGCAFMTAYGAIRHAAGLTMEDSVAVIAVGGVGLCLVQLARAVGVKSLIAVDPVDDKLALARTLGATHTINPRREDPERRIRELTDGQGVNVVFEALGHPDTFRTALEAVADGGRAVILGLAPTSVSGVIDLTRLVRRKIQIIGSYGGRPRSDLPAVIDLGSRRLFSLDRTVTRKYSLEHTNDAYEALRNGEIAGRAIICPSLTSEMRETDLA